MTSERSKKVHENLIEGFRLSPPQRRLWRLQELDGPGPYVARCAVLIEGVLEPETLREAVEQTANRNEILRTTFQSLPEINLPLQIIGESQIFWRQEQRPMLEESTGLEALMNETEEVPFDLEHGPMLQASLFTIQRDRHFLIIALPALSADMTTLRKVMVEIGHRYAALLSGEDYVAESIQYAEISEWQNELLESDDTNEGRGYWRRQLPLAANPLKLPGQKHGFENEPYEACCFTMTLPASCATGIDQFSRESRFSIQAFLLACWQTLLWRLTGEREFAVHTSFDGRRFAELENALGLCSRYLPVRSQLKMGLSFAGLVKSVDATLSETDEWQDYFIEENDLLPNFKMVGSRLGFEYIEWPSPIKVSDLSISFCKLYSLYDRFDLKLSFFHKENSMVAEFHFNGGKFQRSAIERLAAHLNTLISSALSQPDNSISELELLSSKERRQLLIEFNDTARESLNVHCLHKEFESQVETTPERVAAVFHDEQLSYSELNARANQLAHFLQGQGVGPEKLVGICLDRSIDMLTAMLGILKAGGAYLPLDQYSPKERLAFMLGDAKVELLITHQKFKDMLPRSVKRLVLDEDRELIRQHSRENPQSEVAVDNLAYVIYTSGSTGQPKGVAVPHSGLLNYLRWCTEAYGVAEGQGSPVHSPIAFDLTVTSIFAPLLAGREVVLLDEEQASGDALAAALRDREDFSLVKLTPAHLEWLSHTLNVDEASGSTRALIVGGEALSAESLLFWRKHSPETRIINEYGPTETVVGCCVYEVPADEILSGAIPIGRPIANTQLYILDEQMTPAPLQVVGEIYIGGAGVARGYLNRPDLTAERFVPDPFSRNAGQRLYKTGDLGRYRPDGIVEFLGRSDHQVKIKGYRIELGEIEAVLVEHEEVSESVVMLRDEKGDDKRLVGYVATRHGSKLSGNELRAYLQTRLPEYMIPPFFVILERLPLTTNGKIDRQALPLPDQLMLDIGREYAAPRNRSEELLASIWEEILGLERVGINDNFFELGGDSIRGIQAIARANRAGVQLTPHQLFQHQTIARLAPVAGSLPTVQSEQGVVEGAVPLTPIQRWFFDRDLPEPNHFNQSVLLEVRHGVDFLLLRKAVGLLLTHHDALRLRFARKGPDWKQYHATLDESEPISQVTLSASTEEEYQAAIEETVARLQSTLDLLRGPVLRFTLFNSSVGLPDRLHITIHHLVMDGVSWRILLEDLELCYQQLARGEDVRFPPKTTSYKYWAQQLSAYAQSETLRQEAAYWIAEVGTVVQPLPLDFRREPESNTMAAACTISLSLSPEATKALLYEVPQSHRVQVNEVLLTALGRTLGQWTGSDSLLVFMEGHGRQDLFGDVDLSRTVGWFTALFPVQLALSPGSSNPGDELKAVKEQLRRIPSHGVGYGLLRYLSEDKEIVKQLEALPQAELLFNYFGNFDHILPDSSGFRICRESMEGDRSLKTGRDVLLEVNAYVMGGRLTCAWTYSSKLHRRETIEALAQGFVESVDLLINYCQADETTGYTPSDFPKSKLNQNELDHLFSKLMAARGESA